MILTVTSRFSQDKKREEKYQAFLRRQNKTLKTVMQFGHRLMRRARLHPHFFGDNTLKETARFLTLYALHLPQEYHDDRHLNLHLSNEDLVQVFALFEKRIAERIPVEYITQEAAYLGRHFYVNEHVLVPRSLMNARFQDFLSSMAWGNRRVLDLCAGSGCIGISLALMDPQIKVDLADISADALKVAAVNIRKFSLESRVRCIQGDLFENIRDKYDLIISNPPYVSTAEYQSGPLEFKNEPQLALESGRDGLDLINRLLIQAKDYLNPQGKIIAEVGFPAARRLKWRYPLLPFKWYRYRQPSGKLAFMAMDCVFECQAQDLPPPLPYREAGWLRRLVWWMTA